MANINTLKKEKQVRITGIHRISMSDYLDGLTDAYIELLERGIRDVCMPNIGDPEAICNKKYASLRRSFLDLVDRKAKAHGFGVLPVIGKRKRVGSSTADRFAAIIFTKPAKPKALMLRGLLLKGRKTADDHRKIGRLFSYGEIEIKEFIARLKNGALGIKNRRF